MPDEKKKEKGNGEAGGSGGILLKTEEAEAAFLTTWDHLYDLRPVCASPYALSSPLQKCRSAELQKCRTAEPPPQHLCTSTTILPAVQKSKVPRVQGSASPKVPRVVTALVALGPRS